MAVEACGPDTYSANRSGGAGSGDCNDESGRDEGSFCRDYHTRGDGLPQPPTSNNAGSRYRRWFTRCAEDSTGTVSATENTNDDGTPVIG